MVYYAPLFGKLKAEIARMLKKKCYSAKKTYGDIIQFNGGGEKKSPSIGGSIEPSSIFTRYGLSRPKISLIQ